MSSRLSPSVFNALTRTLAASNQLKRELQPRRGRRIAALPGAN